MEYNTSSSNPATPNIAARLFLEAGVSFIPMSADGTKRPLCKWSQWANERPTEKEIESWFPKWRNVGIAMIAGPVSGNLEVTELEAIADRKAFAAKVSESAPDLLSKLIVVASPKGGRHMIYRCPEIDGNQKLAYKRYPAIQGDAGARQVADGSWVRYETMIETRGGHTDEQGIHHAGYVLAPGSPPCCHTTNRPYRLLQGDYRAIPEITSEERAILHQAAMSFDESLEPIKPKWSECPKRPLGPGEKRPGDDFSDQVTGIEVGEILKTGGWSQTSHGHNGGQLWRRPGKKDAWSAVLYPSGVLHVYTSNAAPFEPDHSYAPFDVFTIIYAHGDFSYSALMLAQAGYGHWLLWLPEKPIKGGSGHYPKVRYTRLDQESFESFLRDGLIQILPEAPKQARILPGVSARFNDHQGWELTKWQ